MVRAHRFAWELAYGPIPGGAEVIHRCGTRLCMRPDHLALRVGGRASTGPTPRELAVLRARVRHGLRYGSLKHTATELGVNSTTVANRLAKMRARIGVTSNRDAIAWLDEHEPGWRAGGVPRD
jgi:DNA-binding CsgD family transcriptional regulator